MSTSSESPAAVNTKQVAGRRELHFDKSADILAEARRLAKAEQRGDIRLLGNWSLGQILMHLARSADLAIDGVDFRFPLWMRLVAPLGKKRFLKGPLPAGFQLPQAFARHIVPGETSTEAGLKALDEALQRLETETTRAPHPALGRLTREEWDSLNLRHAEMHLGFVVPAESAE